MTRKSVIQSFLNDEVEQLRNSVYLWRGIMYEILPYKEILKDKTTRADHFIKYLCNDCTYGLRELSMSIFKKRYT